MDALNWALDEFGDADLGDLRRTDRLVRIASKVVVSPECSLSKMMGNEADNKGAQRFWGSESFDYRDVILPIVENTLTKTLSKERVLLIQDTSHLNYDDHPATLGLGHIGSTDDKSFQGIMMHWTLALDFQGECLGLAHLKLWEREKDPRKKCLNEHQNKPIEKKESYKWLESVSALDGRFDEKTQLVWVADREADIYDFIDVTLSKGHDFVIRSNNDRIISDEEGLLKERARTAKILGTQKLNVSRKGKQVEINVNIQACDIGLLAQRRKGGAKSERLCKDHEISVVRVSAKDPKFDFEWILLTSLRVESLEDCLEIIWIYKQRWHIESIHKTLKSGFRAEEITLSTSEKLKKAIAIMLPCAVRIYWMAHKQKHEPNIPANKILEPMECALLNLNRQKPSDYKTSIKEAWLWIGYMGGFRGSKNSAPPGQIVFWRGYMTLKAMVAGAQVWAKHQETKKCVH